MSFLEKERQLIHRLQETNYEMFDGDKEEAMDFIGSQLEKFPNYANIVITQQVMMPLWKVNYEGAEFRDKVQNMDTRRRYAHESAITSVNALNRFCKNLGMEPFADIDGTDRYAVADFIGEYVSEIYKVGTDVKANSNERGYDLKTPHAQLNQMLLSNDSIESSGVVPEL